MHKIEYLPKSFDSYKEPWTVFGAPSKAEYERWSPQVCGICCVKMIGDTLRLTKQDSLYSLTMECLSLGGYRIGSDGLIQGVFHKPLLELARAHGLDGVVEQHLSIQKVIDALSKQKFVILSIDKAKVNPSLLGGHLILVHTYKPQSDIFYLNDPEPILAENGADIKMQSADLQIISNNRGLIIHKKQK